MDEILETQNASGAERSFVLNVEKIFWSLAIAVVAGFFLFFAFAGLVAPANAAVQPNSGGQQYFAPPSQPAQLSPPPTVKNGVQEDTLSVQGGSYMPSPITVKKGIPVRLVGDISQMPGCSKSIIIPEFGVRKVLRQGDNTIEFTPDKSGTFDFTCSMGMYRGKIVVEEADGTVAAYAGSTPKPAGGAGAGASCGANGGGCGCGG